MLLSRAELWSVPGLKQCRVCGFLRELLVPHAAQSSNAGRWAPVQRQLLFSFTALFSARCSVTLIQPCHLVLIFVFLWSQFCVCVTNQEFAVDV